MASNGRKLEALTVFSHSIRYLKDKAIEIIREVTGDDGYNAMDIQWVLTVPAIWKPAAKQFMREAAYMVNNTNTFFSHFVHFFLSFLLSAWKINGRHFKICVAVLLRFISFLLFLFSLHFLSFRVLSFTLWRLNQANLLNELVLQAK